MKVKQKKKGRVLKIIGIVLLCIVLLMAVGISLVLGKSGFVNIFSGGDVTGEMQPLSFTASNGQELPYMLYLPDGYDGSKSLPVVLFLHGAGERGTDNTHVEKNTIMQTLFEDANKAAYPCIVVAPQCPEDVRWSVMIGDTQGSFSPDLDEVRIDAVMELVNAVADTYNADTSRLYATGVSMGAGGIYALLMRYPGTFAAAVVSCGYGAVNGAELIKDLPIWIFHGTWDMTTPLSYSQDMVAALEAAGSTSYTYTEYPRENHTVWELAFREEELFPWLFTQAL